MTAEGTARDIMIVLRQAGRGDDVARLVHAWRTDPLTRAMFFRPFDADWEEFRARFATDYFRDPALHPLIAYDGDGNPAAFVAFRRVEDEAVAGRCADISINVAPEARGRGIATAALRAVPRSLAGTGVDTLIAVIKVENTASRRAFEKAGFKLRRETTRRIAETGETVPVVELVLEIGRSTGSRA